ncbi:MAG: protein translocase subunit SecD [Gammaproteobacteria bacterium]
MINQYPSWKYLLIALALLTGIVYAVPNLFGSDLAVQISAARGAAVDETLSDSALDRLKRAGLTPSSSGIVDDKLLMRFENEDDQLKAKTELRDELDRQYVVALNLAQAAPRWMSALGALPMYLGLDLRGGVHFLLEVDMDGALRTADARYASDLRSQFREDKIRHTSLVRRESSGLAVKFKDADMRTRAYELLRRDMPELEVTEEDGGEQNDLLVGLSEAAQREVREFALSQNITTLRNRVNELGVAEPVIQQQGANRIVVQLPGVQDTAKAKEILGATATLEFRMADEQTPVVDALAGRVPATSKLYEQRDGGPILLKKSIMLTGESIVDASSGIDSQTGSPAVYITLDGKGARIFSKRTGDQIGRRMATVFIENKTETRVENGEEVKKTWTVEEVINVATIRDQLGKRFQITGLDSTTEARDLALLLRAGSLAAPIEIVEERTVGPSLGQDNIDQGFRSVVIGFVLVLIFMAIYYKVFGLIANLALTVNLVLIVALLSMLQATLTLPGIAGIVLTVGMAVDANVLIFERIREELRNGNTPQASIHAGYAKAFSTIADANITTLIAAVVLLGFGTGPIKGFAVTLALGIATSMFTAILGTRAVVNLIYGQRRIQALPI